jgi:GDP-4-dehydro-6-deoxy-D-mannose reductase
VKVLVTGAGGFAGRHLLRELLSRGAYELAGTVLEDSEDAWPDESLAGVTWFGMDVTNESSVADVVGEWRPDKVYHLAGQASVGRSFEAPLETWDINATGTLRVLEAMGRLDGDRRRLLLISSAEVYGEVDAKNQPISEDSPIRPITPYGASKAAAEIAAIPMGQNLGIEVVVARSFNHIGPGQDDRFVLPSMAQQLDLIWRGEKPPVLNVGNLDVERDFLDVRDAVKGYVLLMEHAQPGNCYNVCTGVAHSLATLVRRLIELSETGASLEFDPARGRPADIPRLVGDSSRLRALGWDPGMTLDETLHDLLKEAEARA